MKILALESSAVAASAALCEDGKCVGLTVLNCGLTHSETLLPMAENLLGGCRWKLGDIDLIAVAHGPGSFTGVRIGVSTAKGLSWGADKPCCGVSTLESMAWQGAHLTGRLLCCCMDARRSQVYNALFRAEGEGLTRLTPDRALSLAELLPELAEEPVLIGDGAALTAKFLSENARSFVLAPEPIRTQSAWGVAMAAMHAPKESWGEPNPVYLRLSQAERDRNARLQRENEENSSEKEKE